MLGIAAFLIVTETAPPFPLFLVLLIAVQLLVAGICFVLEEALAPRIQITNATLRLPVLRVVSRLGGIVITAFIGVALKAILGG